MDRDIGRLDQAQADGAPADEERQHRQPLCRDLESETISLHKSYLARFGKTHFFSLVSGTWDAETYSPLRERESERNKGARLWYREVTRNPVLLGRRIAQCLNALELEAYHEREIRTPHGSVRADVIVIRPAGRQNKVIVEIKAFSPEQATPSAIRDAIRTTLRRHAQLAGFLPRQ